MVWLWQKRAGKNGTSVAEVPWLATLITESSSPVGAGGGVEAAVDVDGKTEAGEAQPRGIAAPVIVRVAGEPERWALVAPRRGTVRVNGLNLLSGIRILRHRDELVANGDTEFFSTERLAEIEPFAGSDQKIYCGRCGVELVNGEGVVRCPCCATLYHQNESRSCWIYRDGDCTFCKHPATLDGQFLWTPEAI